MATAVKFNLGPFYGLKCETMVQDDYKYKCIFSKTYNEIVKHKEIRELNELFNSTKYLREAIPELCYYYCTSTDGIRFTWNYIRPEVLISFFEKNK